MAPSGHNTLRDTALETNKSNPSQLGDPISLKAETSDTSPTTQDRGAASSSPSSKIKDNAPAPMEGDDDSKRGSDGKGNGGEYQTLRQKAMQKLDENPSQLGDPVSLKAEKADSEPTEGDRGAGRSKL